MFSASDVKNLREKTGAGMLDCKKALDECQGDIDKAVDWLREKGIAKAAKKTDRIAAEGLSEIFINGNKQLYLKLIVKLISLLRMMNSKTLLKLLVKLF